VTFSLEQDDDLAKKIAKTPREHFMQAAADELARFVGKEIAFQKADRDERAMKLRLPISQFHPDPLAAIDASSMPATNGESR
jgi:hypothetical protein